MRTILCILFLLISLAGYSQNLDWFEVQQQQSTLLGKAVFWYDFDETTGTTLYDKTSNSFDGANDANVTIQSDGIDQYHFAASAESVVSDHDLLTPSGAFSIAAIITTPSSFTNYNGFIGKSNEFLVGFFNEAKLQLRLYNNGTSTFISFRTSMSFSASTEYFIVVNYDGTGDSGIDVYVDNVSQAGTPWGGTVSVSNTTNDLLIGAYGYGNGLNGKMRQLVLFDDILTADERSEWYNSGTKVYYENL